MKPKYPKAIIFLFPAFGMVLFVIFYTIAAFNYPGGSWRFPQQLGFSFWNNYLCDLLDTNAINGELNNARYFARMALGLLCVSLLLLWNQLPTFFKAKSRNKMIMWISGNLALIITFFLTSGTHDITVRIAGFFGLIAFISCFIELFKSEFYKLFSFGLVCLFVFVVNYFIYETGIAIHSLPIIQKVTFVLFLCWFALLNLTLYRKLVKS